MKRLPLLAAAIILWSLLSLGFKQKAQKIDLSGDWKYSLEKTKSLYGLNRGGPQTIKMEQAANSLKITTSKYRNSSATLVTLSFDGKQSDVKALDKPDGPAVRKATAQWSQDGKELTIKYRDIIEGKLIEGDFIDVFSLKDGLLILNAWVYEK